MVEVKMVACDLTHLITPQGGGNTQTGMGQYGKYTQTGMTPPPSLHLLSN